MELSEEAIKKISCLCIKDMEDKYKQQFELMDSLIKDPQINKALVNKNIIKPTLRPSQSHVILRKDAYKPIEDTRKAIHNDRMRPTTTTPLSKKNHEISIKKEEEKKKELKKKEAKKKEEEKNTHPKKEPKENKKEEHKKEEHNKEEHKKEEHKKETKTLIKPKKEAKKKEEKKDNKDMKEEKKEEKKKQKAKINKKETKAKQKEEKTQETAKEEKKEQQSNESTIPQLSPMEKLLKLEWTDEEKTQIVHSQDLKATATEFQKNYEALLPDSEKLASNDVKPCPYVLSTSDESATELLNSEVKLPEQNPSDIEMNMMRYLFTVLGKEVKKEGTWEAIVKECKTVAIGKLITDNISRAITVEQYKDILLEYEKAKNIFTDDNIKFDGFEYIVFIKMILQSVNEFYAIGKPLEPIDKAKEPNAYYESLKHRIKHQQLVEKSKALSEIINAH